MDFMRAPKNLELYAVGKLLMYSLSEFIAGIANPRTLGIKKCYFTYSFKYVYYSDNAICTYSLVIQKEVTTWPSPMGLRSHFEHNILYINNNKYTQ